jgi:hypothetical protein
VSTVVYVRLLDHMLTDPAPDWIAPIMLSEYGQYVAGLRQAPPALVLVAQTLATLKPVQGSPRYRASASSKLHDPPCEWGK